MEEHLSEDLYLQISTLQARVRELEAALEAAHQDPTYSILTRSGINHRWHKRPTESDTVIFFDIDGIHGHNEEWGYEGTNVRVRAVMAQVTSFWVFRWYSGDEFGVLCAASDALGFAARIKRLLEAEGLNATFGIAPIVDNDIEKSMSSAASLVQDAKLMGLRGAIYELYPHQQVQAEDQ